MKREKEGEEGEGGGEGVRGRGRNHVDGMKEERKVQKLGISVGGLLQCD